MFFVLSIALTWRQWWQLLKAPRGKFAAAMLLFGGLAVIAPLAHAHLTDPDMMRRAGQITLWQPDASFFDKLAAIFGRYWPHYGPDFLFWDGDKFPLHSLPGGGVLYWFMLPLVIAGLVVLLVDAWRRPAARILLIWLAIFPLADLFGQHDGLGSATAPHLLRSTPGIAIFPLVAAASLLVIGRRPLELLPKAGKIAVTAVLVAAMAGFGGNFAWRFFTDYPRQTKVWEMYFPELLEASAWIRPRLAQVDTVFMDGIEWANQPFGYALVGLKYPPRQWFADNHDIIRQPTGDVHVGFGKFMFTYPVQSVEARLSGLQKNGRADRVVFCIRPESPAAATLRRAGTTPVHTIKRPDGTVAMEIYDVTM